jgi:translation initiation factor 2 subunit 3
MGESEQATLNIGISEQATLNMGESEQTTLNMGESEQATLNIGISEQATLNMGESEQATLNIGVIGHVAHGKSTLVRALTGIQTTKFKEELERNITIKLGYANAKIYHCESCDYWMSIGESKKKTDHNKCTKCGGKTLLKKHVSFVDCPGHDSYIATMISGAAVMDAVILVIATNEPCPQPQTHEHLIAAEIMKLSTDNNYIVVQSKLDLVKRNDQDLTLIQSGQTNQTKHKTNTHTRSAVKSFQEIKKFIQGTSVENAKIIPISTHYDVNLDIVSKTIAQIKDPVRDHSLTFSMNIIRSFDVNKPGTYFLNMKGGVIGGSITQGKISIGEIIEIRPGIVKRVDGMFVCTPLITYITSLFSEGTSLEIAYPGGLVAIGTKLDPLICAADELISASRSKSSTNASPIKRTNVIGQILGKPGTLPTIVDKIKVRFHLIKRDKADKPKVEETIKLNFGSLTIGGKIIDLINTSGYTSYEIQLNLPACVSINDKIPISKLNANDKWILVGWGQIISFNEIAVKKIIE